MQIKIQNFIRKINIFFNKPTFFNILEGVVDAPLVLLIHPLYILVVFLKTFLLIPSCIHFDKNCQSYDILSFKKTQNLVTVSSTSPYIKNSVLKTS